MKITRRNFLKTSSILAAALMNAGLFVIEGCKSIPDKLKGTVKNPGICPFCSMGCGITAFTRNGKIINIEGDPAHPINGGKLCAKGSALFQLSISKKRLGKILYRAPFKTEWSEITWKEALDKIALNIKRTRDETFVEIDKDTAANRTEGIAVMGGSGLTNEEAYLLSKMSRLLGIIHIYDESGLPNSGSSAALSGSLGYGAMSNHWTDIQNADTVFIIGSNPAETYPVAMKHILQAKENGGKIIHIDPRFTRTSSISDYYAPIRPGTDIAFIGGLINFAIQNDIIHKEYVAEYTNASFIINSEYDFQNGYFTGFANNKYSNDTWAYDRDRKGVPRTDKTLGNRNTVFQIIKKHFERYTIDAVASVTGCPADKFLEIAEVITSTAKAGKAGCAIFSSGLTHHTNGTQNIRALTILQLLLGNIGISGGGMNFLSPGSNSCGCTDNGLSTDMLPGYLPVPDVVNSPNLSSYIRNFTPVTNDPMSINALNRRNVHIINLLKSYYGKTALKQTYFCYDWLPKKNRNHLNSDFFKEIAKSSIQGAVIAGANPVLAIHNSNFKINALEKLKWMVVTDIFENETSAFWKRDGVNPEEIGTEVFLLPAAASLEKTGSITNSGRWVQWSDKASDPPAQAKSDLWIFDSIFKSTRKIIKSDINTFFPEPVIDSNWAYSNNKDNIDPASVAREINGINSSTSKQVSWPDELADNGTTSSGNWLYCGCFTDKGNMMARRENNDLSGIKQFPEWAWSWPENTRILYNRAGVNRTGTPWVNTKTLIKWEDNWEGDNPDGGRMFSPGEKNPFIMLPEGVAKLFDSSIPDGPLPEHYEPAESPAPAFFNIIKYNPCVINNKNYIRLNTSSKYPYIATTYKTDGTRKPGINTANITWIAELVPDNICEISKSLGESKALKTGDRIRIFTKRGTVTARCIVTDRIKPLIVNGFKTEMVAIALNTGHETIAENITQITHDMGDPATNMPETKAFLVNIKGI
ncbi:MAG: formate dehydrogenase-N subunit alpha [Spirochaetes bacterium]|nr:formate dehydrogenase-N subunit alpha [Spirochaetota bacterium]